MKKYKYTAYLIAWSGIAWSHDTITIQVNSKEEALLWIDNHNTPYVDYTLEGLKENK